MANIANMCKIIHEKALERSYSGSTSITEQETFIATSLFVLLEDLSSIERFTIEADHTLEIPDGNYSDLNYDIEAEDDEEQQTTENRHFSLEYMQKVVDFARPGISFTSIHHNFPRVTYPMQLKRFRVYVESDGNRRQKLNRVRAFVLDKFRSARSNYLLVHDLDLQRWAISQAKLKDLDNFTASPQWLLSFKKSNGISSRKVTKSISHREVMDRSVIEETAHNFVTEATRLIPKYKLDSVLNADQFSFHLEIASNRTLSYVGEKTTHLSVKSTNAKTHSYTVMHIINANGQLLNPVFICLQEPTGRLLVRKKIFSASNTVITCSTSGKLSRSLVEYWIREVLDKVVSNRFLILVDQWSP